MSELVVKKEESEIVVSESKVDSLGRSYSTGKRKNSVARVWIKKGNGNIEINGSDAKKYLKREILFNIINFPFDATKTRDKFDVIATVEGGGLSGQAGAIAHGISKSLSLFDPELRKQLRSDGFLTRDPRVVERKKPGLKKARKGQTYRKR